MTGDVHHRTIAFWRRRGIVICVACIGLISLFLKATLPVHAIGRSFLDDELFVRLAHFVVEGSWLGTFDSRTLARGAFYPVFMATAFAIGLPLKIAEQFVYLAASGLMSWSVARLSQSQRLGAWVFIALAFNPVLWDPSLTRVVPMALYMGLSLAVMALAAVLLLDGSEPPAGTYALRTGGMSRSCLCLLLADARRGCLALSSGCSACGCVIPEPLRQSDKPDRYA